MCRKMIYLLSLVVVLGLSGLVQADTVFLGGVLEDPANWTNGWPSDRNPGTIEVDGITDMENPNLQNWTVTQTAGTISGTSLRLQNGEWTITGGSIEYPEGQLGSALDQIITVDGDVNINVATYGHNTGETNLINGTMNVSGTIGFRRPEATIDIYNGDLFMGEDFLFYYAPGGNDNNQAQSCAINFHSGGTGSFALGGNRLDYVEDLVNGTGQRLDQTGTRINWDPGDGPEPNIKLDGGVAYMSDFFVYYYSASDVTIISLVKPALAFAPNPADLATDVPRDVTLSWAAGRNVGQLSPKHRVFFSENFDDVKDGVGGITLDANELPVGWLDLGTTYYWRVDEANSVSGWDRGNIWQFMVEPVGYPIAADLIAATASGTDKGDPNNTFNGSGLEADGTHSQDTGTMWLSPTSEPGEVWIQYEFDQVYKLAQVLVWNHNSGLEKVFGFGIKEALIEVSPDGNDFTHLVTTELAQAAQSTVDMEGTVVKAVRITALSNRSAFFKQYGLSEVRFFYIPLRAREPQPESGATDVDVDLVLSWRAGREAAEHNVYISTDEQAVIDSNVPVTTVTEASHGPLPLDLGETYYWKVNEVNEAETPTMLEGDIWNFTTRDSLVVEDFEDYNDYPGNRIYETWADGWEIPTNGAMLGYPEPLNFAAGEHILETTDVHGGEQSLPFFYDNSTAAYSEATVNIADLPIGSDWTGNGVKTLSLWFSGDVNNVPEQMYMKLNGVKVLYDGDASNLSKAAWQPWNIHLADFAGVNLSNVTELSIGFERIGFSGGSGMVLFDDIRLYH